MAQIFTYTLIALAFAEVFAFACCAVSELIEYIEWKHLEIGKFYWGRVFKNWSKAALVILLAWAFLSFAIWFVWSIRIFRFERILVEC